MVFSRIERGACVLYFEVALILSEDALLSYGFQGYPRFAHPRSPTGRPGRKFARALRRRGATKRA
jgi:hypothetical protein